MDPDDTRPISLPSHSIDDLPVSLGEMTTEQCSALLALPRPVVILPVGSTEAHGPHLPLNTDALISTESAQRATRSLRSMAIHAAVAPTVNYGVTNYASGFAGTVSLSASLVEGLVRELCEAYRSLGFAVVCLVNHHLEPAHIDSLSRGVAAANTKSSGVIFANQLTRRWGGTLSDEFKRGDCHAGSYETSLVLAASPTLVHEEIQRGLPAIPISLSKAIAAGQSTFREIGLSRAYTGTPSAATREEGEDLYQRLTTMVVTEVREALGVT